MKEVEPSREEERGFLGLAREGREEGKKRKTGRRKDGKRDRRGGGEKGRGKKGKKRAGSSCAPPLAGPAAARATAPYLHPPLPAPESTARPWHQPPPFPSSEPSAQCTTPPPPPERCGVRGQGASQCQRRPHAQSTLSPLDPCAAPPNAQPLLHPPSVAVCGDRVSPGDKRPLVEGASQCQWRPHVQSTLPSFDPCAAPPSVEPLPPLPTAAALRAERACPKPEGVSECQ